MLLSATYRTPPLQEEYEIWSKFVYNLDFEGYFRGVYMVFRCIYNKSLVSSNTPMNMNRIKRIILQSNLFITFFSLHSLFNYNNTYIISFYFFILSWFQWSSGNSIIFHFIRYSQAGAKKYARTRNFNFIPFPNIRRKSLSRETFKISNKLSFPNFHTYSLLFHFRKGKR